MTTNKKWPVTVTFAFYFDHEPDGHELGRISNWSENSYGRSVDQIPSVAAVNYGPPVPTAAVDKADEVSTEET